MDVWGTEVIHEVEWCQYVTKLHDGVPLLWDSRMGSED